MRKNKNWTLQSIHTNRNKLLRIFGHEPPEITPLEVRVEDNFDEAAKKFKALFQKERIIGLYKEKQRYEKPSEKRRRKRREATERRLMLEARERMIRSGEWERRQKRKELKRQKKQQERAKQQLLQLEQND